MRTIRDLMLMMSVACFTACTNDTFVEEPSAVDGGNNAIIKGITVTLPQIEGAEEFATTRTQFVMDADGVKAHWAEGDTLGIFPANGDQVSFPITSGIESNTATFDGGDWGLKAGRSYAAYFPYDKWNIFRDNKSIILDYTGQVQKGNNSHTHLGAYDFLAAGQVSPNAAGYLTLDMERLGSIVMLQLTLPEACSPTELIINSHPVSNSEASAALPTKMTLDLSSSSPNVRVSGGSSDFKLQFRDVQLTGSTPVLTAYLMMVPYSYQSDGYFWTVKVNATNGNTYVADIDTKDLEAGKPYKFIATMEKEGAVSVPVLRNANLIAAAEASLGIQFTKNNDGTVTLDGANMPIVESVTALDLSGKGDPTICDEIGYFEYLEELNCSNNQLSSLIVFNNKALLHLYCSDNQLTSLDVSNNISLSALSCDHNLLLSLDISNNTSLAHLDCSYNQLTTLDVSNNSLLNSLWCRDNQLTSLDLSNNTLLTYLGCFENQLTSLNISNSTLLVYLGCSNNQLTSLDVTNNTALISLFCDSNQLTSLDVSNNSLLSDLGCGGSSISSNNLSLLDVSNNTALTYLHCEFNQLTSLDVSNNTALTDLDCGGNQLTSLDVSNNSSLTGLYCYDNQLTSLGLFNNSLLISLYCDGNQLTLLDLSNNKSLNLLWCYHNKMTDLDISNNIELELQNVNVGNQTGELTLYVNETQSSQTLSTYMNDNVIVLLKDDSEHNVSNQNFEKDTYEW